MPIRKNDVLAHFKMLHRVIDQAGREAILSFANFSVFIRGQGQDHVLYPQFLAESQGTRRYVQTFSHDAKQFIGWLPYYNKRWELASDKLKFKRYALEQGLLTPEYTVEPGHGLRDVLIKRAQSSFGALIKGPFRDSSALSFDASRGEYLERFISGKILKIWYWDGKPACMEIDAMPSVVGDGVSTIKELVLRRVSEQGKLRKEEEAYDFSEIEQVLAYSGKNLDDVLPRHTKQRVQIRYGSDLKLPSDRKIVNLQKKMPEDLAASLTRIGEVAWLGIPVNIRQGTVFTIDAILDADRKIWVLEMNSNPAVHPLVYPLMGKTLFGYFQKQTEAVH